MGDFACNIVDGEGQVEVGHINFATVFKLPDNVLEVVHALPGMLSVHGLIYEERVIQKAAIESDDIRWQLIHVS